MIPYIFLAGFAIPGLLVLMMVAFAPRLNCPKCDGDMQMVFNGDYRCDDCHYYDEDDE